MKIFIRLIIPILISVCMGFNELTVFAESTGDPNIDSGGGGMGSGTSQNFWSPSDDGVRITVVDAETGEKKSQSIDYTNKQPSNISLHFGNVCKTEYIGGKTLSPQTGGYSYMNPSEPLPAIVGDGEYWSSNIDQIRSYFTDEQVVSSIAGHMGFTLDELTSGDYKLMIEPVIYITYNGTRCALTATEMALYNQQTNGDMKRYFADLSHKNLPLAMFLEEDDLGYRAWSGSTNSRMTDSDIINYLGVGIVSFKEKEDEVEVDAFDYEYRVDTDVYTSITVSGGEHTHDNPVTVIFEIKNKRYTVNNVVYPDGDSQLVWCKWHTPQTEQQVEIKVTVYGGAEASETDITANIVDLDKNPPPNPTAYDRNNGFTASSVPQKEEKSSNSWSVWSAYWAENWVWTPNWSWVTVVLPNGKVTGYWQDNGRWEDRGDWIFESKSYRVSLSAEMKITPDEKNPTASGKNMKSGYGINEKVTSSVSGNGEHTDMQNAVTYFPEFGYETYWRLLESSSGGSFEFKENKYSTYNNRTHFTPLWYPDGTYTAYTWALDCWTPAGMLSLNLTDDVSIDGNVYDDWHIGPTY